MMIFMHVFLERPQHGSVIFLSPAVYEGRHFPVRLCRQIKRFPLTFRIGSGYVLGSELVPCTIYERTEPGFIVKRMIKRIEE